MKLSIICAAALALSATAAAAQQRPPALQVTPLAKTAPAAATAPAASADASATTGFRAGLPVKDAQGAAIGTIARIIKTPDGATTYSVSVDGHTVNLPGSALTLSPTGAEAISSLTKAQITATTPPPT